ncbi:transposase family protein [Nostoc sp. TCL240-02]|uniref:transposase family protein n=1 Tax=Nostoc sp. TCL240-02 TaxID=2572090 RepID=UPI00157FBBC9|nr:transposase family protein [Nostoc sp. TCL240-02]QKQ73412.1 transposase family protein [Nostoc sp. TCL240-02]
MFWHSRPIIPLFILKSNSGLKLRNQKLSSRRIGVEHLICRVKTFRVASDRFRLARHRYNQMIMAVCGLVRLHLNHSFILSHDI